MRNVLFILEISRTYTDIDLRIWIDVEPRNGGTLVMMPGVSVHSTPSWSSVALDLQTSSLSGFTIKLQPNPCK